MMCKTMLVVVLVALAASASAYPWRPCGHNRATIKSVSIEGCDPLRRCKIEANSNIGVNVNFSNLNKIQHPVMRMETEDGGYDEDSACESISSGNGEFMMSHLTAPASTYETNSTVQFSIREYGSSVKDAPVCFEVLMDSYRWRDSDVLA